MTLINRASGWSETWRVLAYTLVIALAFIALGRMQLALFSAAGTAGVLEHVGLVDHNPDARLLDEAAQVAAASQGAEQRLTAGHRLATLRLGYELGYASQWVGAYALSPAEVQAQARSQAEPHLALARDRAALLGLPPPQAWPVTSLKDFTELNNRIEADESGLAARVQQQLSAQHRHLYLLGAHLGTEGARVEGSGGKFALPPAALIRRHATLAGVDPALWQPLTLEPNNELPAQVLSRYRAALNALASGLEPGSPLKTEGEPR